MASLSANTAASGLMLTGPAPLTEAAFGGLRRKEPGPHSGDTHVPVSTQRTAAQATKSAWSARRGEAEPAGARGACPAHLAPHLRHVPGGC